MTSYFAILIGMAFLPFLFPRAMIFLALLIALAPIAGFIWFFT